MRNRLLSVRDGRQAAIWAALAEKAIPWVATVSLAIPGSEKNPPGAAELFGWARNGIAGMLSPGAVIADWIDALGPFLLAAGDDDPIAFKRQAIALEDSHPAARVLDVDVFIHEGIPLGRKDLYVPARPCFLCSRPARECIRLGRHAPEDVIFACYAMLRSFRDSLPGRMPR